jgi:hypothetical protein
VRCPQAPQAKQQQKKRTFDVLQNADSFTRYGHTPAGARRDRVERHRLGKISKTPVLMSIRLRPRSDMAPVMSLGESTGGNHRCGLAGAGAGSTLPFWATQF